MKLVEDLIFDGAKVGSYEREIANLKILKGFKQPSSFIDNTTHIGIEVEVERISREGGLGQLSAETYIWKNIADGSLRNSGREFVSIPIKGEDISFALSLLNEHFLKDKTCVAHEFTDRTSVHVHLNAREFSVAQYKSFLLTYLLVEPLLYSFVGGDRAKNIFCVPIVESDLAGVVSSLLDASSDEGSLGAIRGWQKYTGLNLLPTLEYGTIEFRHMVGTGNIETLTNWINLIFSIKRFAFANSPAQLLELANSLNTTSEYLGTINRIFGDLTEVLDLSNVQEHMEHSSGFLKEVMFGSQNTNILKDAVMVIPYETYKKSTLITRAIKFGLIEIEDVRKAIAKLEKQISDKGTLIRSYEEHKKQFAQTYKADGTNIQARDYANQYRRAIKEENVMLDVLKQKLVDLQNRVSPTITKPRFFFDDLVPEVAVNPEPVDF